MHSYIVTHLTTYTLSSYPIAKHLIHFVVNCLVTIATSLNVIKQKNHKCIYDGILLCMHTEIEDQMML